MRAILMFCFSLLLVKAFAQDYKYDKIYEKERRMQQSLTSPEKQAYFFIKVDAAVPLGAYGDDDLYKYSRGQAVYFAETGVDLSLQIGKTFTKVVGINVSAGYIKNGAGLNQLIDAINFSQAQQGGGQIENYEYNGYHHLYTTAGLLLTAHLKKIAFDFRAQIGISYGIDAEENYDVNYGPPDIVHVQTKRATDLGFMPQLGISLRAPVKGNLTLIGNLDYKYTGYTFSTTQVQSANGTPPQIFQLPSYDVRAHILSIGAGIGFSF